MSSAVWNSWRTTAVPWPSSNSTFSPLEFTPGGGPPASWTRARSCCIRSELTSVNLTARTYIANLLLVVDDSRRYLVFGRCVKPRERVAV